MIASLKRRGLYEVSIEMGKDSYENQNDQLNDSDRALGAICLALSLGLHYLIGSVEYPKDLQTELDRTFGKKNEDHYTNLDDTPNTTRFIYSKFLASTHSDEVVQDEEEAEYSTQSI